MQEYDEEYEEEYEDEDEDEDVFAFVPPDLGPSPALQQNVSTDPYAAQPAYAQAPHEQQAFAEQGAWAGTGEHQAGQEAEEEHFFYDEATGAVYDSSGRLVQLPNGFDPATALVSGAGEEQAVAASQNQSRNSGSTAVDGNLVALQRAAEPSGVQQLADQSPLHGDIAGDGRGDSIDVPVMPGYGSRRAAALLQNEGVRLSLDRKSSNASSFNSVSRDINGPVLSHARSMGGFPSMEVLDEVNDLPSSRDGMVTLPHGQRDIGMTAHGGMSLDTKVPAHAHAGHARHASVGSNAGAGMGDEGMRHRTNRLSFGADNNRSPDSELKFKLDPDDYDDEAGMESGDKFGYMGRSSISEQVMGQGNGLAHPTMDGATIGPNGVRMVELEMEMEEDSPYPEVSLPCIHPG